MAKRTDLMRKKTEMSIIRQMRGRVDQRHNVRLEDKVLVEELRQGSKPAWMELLVLRAYSPRQVNLDGKEHVVVAACARDESGVTGIVLWNEDALRVEQGDVLRIHRGWVRISQGRTVLSAGRHGWIEVISTSHGSDISRMSCGRTWNRPPCAP